MKAEYGSKLWYFDNFNFLNVMSKDEKMELSQCSVMKQIKQDESVYLPHDLSSKIYFLKEGRVKIVSFSDDGRELIHALLHPGQIFGELALAGEKTRESYAVVTEDAIICQVALNQFERILKNNPLLTLEVTKLIGFRLKRIRTRLERMWFKSAEDRVRSVLNELKEDFGKAYGDGVEIPLRLKHHEIASLAATTRQTASSVLAKLEQSGLIHYDRKKIVLYGTL
ncbi:MAG: Crp/Fnr family transcriptional regulator [Carboxylicivirga sp.]|jgi:CRP-like cAMP-binding protein|nr:Crp/Fnr family transcriptional regulator [Carboxylicivirga sp.]MCT4644340.1 Crp/Fnr family transcriptional regulator [Carboxylicivirga sp.]